MAAKNIEKYLSYYQENKNENVRKQEQ